MGKPGSGMVDDVSQVQYQGNNLFTVRAVNQIAKKLSNAGLVGEVPRKLEVGVYDDLTHLEQDIKLIGKYFHDGKEDETEVNVNFIQSKIKADPEIVKAVLEGMYQGDVEDIRSGDSSYTSRTGVERLAKNIEYSKNQGEPGPVDIATSSKTRS